MPTYDYECEHHGQFDCVMSVAEMRREMPCPKCGEMCRKIIVNGHGGARRSDSEWIRGVGKFFETPMETVSDLRKFYAEHPDIRPKESHPALPSSLGDVKRPPSYQENFQSMKKKALDWVRKDNTLSVTAQTSA